MLPNLMVTYMHTMAGNIDFPAFVPVMGTTGQHPLSYLERLKMVLINEFANVFTELYYFPM